jgi:hypothetical protein
LRRNLNTKRKLLRPKRTESKRTLSKVDAGIILIIIGAIIFFGNGFKVPLPIFGEEIEIFLIIFGRMLELNITNSVFWKTIGILLMIFGATKSAIAFIKLKKAIKANQ